jgi:hypothetical protein
MKCKENKEYFLFINKKSTGTIESCDGSFNYATNGIFHHKNGLRHREDGPACEYANGNKFWYLNDISYSKDKWKTKVRKLRSI